VGFLDEVLDRLVNDHGVGDFKFDYNIRAGVGSDANTASTGHGLLLHNRAYLAWVDALRQRHPRLVLENCASGGMRQDFASVSRFDLQSTSDQEDFHAYAPIAAAAPDAGTARTGRKVGELGLPPLVPSLAGPAC
jgi:alpha-galactosidase